MCTTLPLGLVVADKQLRQQARRVMVVWRREDDLASPALVGDDQVLVGLEMPSATVNVFEEQSVQMQQERDRERLILLEAHDRVDGVSIAGELLLVAISKARVAVGDPLGPILRNGDVLDRVRSRDRGDARILRERTQELGRLVGEETFLPLPGVDPG